MPPGCADIRPGTSSPEVLHQVLCSGRLQPRFPSRPAKRTVAGRKSPQLRGPLEAAQGAGAVPRPSVSPVRKDARAKWARPRRAPHETLPILRRSLAGQPRCAVPVMPHARRRSRQAWLGTFRGPHPAQSASCFPANAASATGAGAADETGKAQEFGNPHAWRG
jgi:hypothetical protein